MQSYEKLLLENKAWSEEKRFKEPDYFERLATDQTPEFLWIGCSDSRVPAEIIVNAEPGTIFAHRNIANQVIATDFNSLSVIEYAVEVLKVRHIIVCGHYNCGGVRAALERQNPEVTLVNTWLMHVRDIYRVHQKEIEELPTEKERLYRFVELNVREQVRQLAHTSIIQTAWRKHESPTLHGWVYAIENGLLRQLITLSCGDVSNSFYL